MEQNFSMNISSLSKYALAAVASASILAACSAGSQSGMGSAAGTTPSMKGGIANLVAHNGVLHAAGVHGVINPDKKAKGGFAYITDYGANVVYVYDYSSKTGKFGSEAGSTTSGISGPQGACASKKGEAYIANTNDSNLLGYKGGSTTSNATLTDTGEYPAGCSVDKKGDVAVSNICNSASCGAGDVAVFKGGTGSPTAITCPNLRRYYFIAYDSQSNIWVDGEDSSYAFALCEIKAGSSSGTAITLNVIPEFPGGVAVSGKDVTVMDQDTDTVDQYTISGTSGTEVGSVDLSGASDPVQDWIAKKYVLASNAGEGSTCSWKYPAGGSEVSCATGFSEPIGVSVAK
jgi:hypothetical protein